MIWGYPHFRKPAYTYIYCPLSLSLHPRIHVFDSIAIVSMLRKFYQ